MMREDSPKHPITATFGLILALALCAACYWPSLSGPFIFDDYPNLSPIGEFGGIQNWDTFWHYISSGNAGPLGRPISLMSFTLNAQNWPADPHPFRLTNLGIHLFNGVLVFLLAGQLFRLAHTPRKAAQLALFATSLWLLHPLLVSTTAFIVQRMTQLACMFSLLALIGYMHGRIRLSSEPKNAWLWIMSSMGIGGALAIFSKESGILLPLFALCIEATLFAGDQTKGRRWALTLLALPCLALAGYLASRIPGIDAAYARRDFTLVERLMTEPRIVMDYLSRLLFPRMQGAGLYHDDFSRSSGLLTPPTTLASILGIIALLCVGWMLRRKMTFLSLGILWFFAGHVLESTLIPLELYYEHRNYLPAIGIAIAAASICLPTNQNLKKVVPVLAVLFIALEASITWQNAVMWSSQKNLVHITVQEHPTSLRGLERAALYYAAKRDYRTALSYLQRAVELHPNRNSIKLSLVQTQCLLDELNPEEFASVISTVAKGGYEKESIQYLPEFTRLASLGVCEGITHSSLQQLLDAFLKQRKKGKPRVPLHLIRYHRAHLHAAEGKYDEAIRSLDASFKARPKIDILLLQVVWLISVHDFDNAQKYLDVAQHMNAKRSLGSINRAQDIDGYQGIVDRGDSNPKFRPFVYPLEVLSAAH